MRGAVGVLVLSLLLTACQVTDPEGQVEVTAGAIADDAPEPALGSPDEDWPRTTQAMRAFALPEAQTWQDDPVLADFTVFLAEGEWESVRLTYVAADAERMLVYESTPEQLSLERPLLEGLQLLPVPGAAIAAIEVLPEGALEPVELAEASATALADCDAAGEEVRAVLYATGAPAAWDGTQWTRTPTWRATVVTDSTGVLVEVESGQAFAPLTCTDTVLPE